MEKYLSYGAHAVAYVVSAAALVAGLDPALLTTLMGPKAIAIIGGAAFLGTFIHNVQAAYAKSKDGTVTTVVKSFAVFALVAVLSASVLVGCKTAPALSEKSTVTIATYLVVGQTLKNGNATPAVQAARAAEFKSVAVKLQAVNDDASATLATLAANLAPSLAKLNPSDRLAAQAVVVALTPYLQSQVENNPTVAYSQERLATILTAVIAACDAYIQPEVTP